MPIEIRRLSDGSRWLIDSAGPGSFIREVKSKIKKDFKPAHPNGCRLVYNGKVLKSRHRVKHYKIPDGGTIDMDDTKNWSSSSSSSSSED